MHRHFCLLTLSCRAVTCTAFLFFPDPLGGSWASPGFGRENDTKQRISLYQRQIEKGGKEMRKRLLSWVLLFALALSLLPMGTLAAEETQSWQEAYREYIQSDLENTAGSGYLDGAKEETRYFLFDVNEDSIPELWINYSTSAYGKRLCSYANRQVQVQNVAYGELPTFQGSLWFYLWRAHGIFLGYCLSFREWQF